VITRGRKSAAAKLVALPTSGIRPKLTTPSCLTKAEASTFTELVRANAHLTVTDAPLLTSYVQALAMMHRLAKAKDVGEWERCGRMALALARALRLTPISTADPQTLGRRRKDQPPPQQWLQELDDDDEADD